MKFQLDKSDIYEPNYIDDLVLYASTNKISKQGDLPLDMARKVSKIAKDYENFYNFVLGLFATIKPIYKDGILDAVGTLVSALKEPVIYRDKEYLAKSYLGLYRNLPVSLFVTSQIKSKYHSTIPMWLYAHKLYNDVPYNAWRLPLEKFKGDSASMYYKYILGNLFIPIIDYCLKQGNLNLDVADRDYLEDIRIKMVTGVAKGQVFQYPFTQWKANQTGDEAWQQLPVTYRMMLAQIWLFNSQVRTKYTLADWNDWDNMPEPLDSVKNTLEIKKFSRSMESDDIEYEF